MIFSLSWTYTFWDLSKAFDGQVIGTPNFPRRARIGMAVKSQHQLEHWVLKMLELFR